MTGKQSTFVREYLVDLNATQAAIRAGYSERTAYSIGQENLNKPEIRQAIDSAMSERNERTKLTQDYVIDNLMEIVSRTMQKKPVMVKGEQLQDEAGRGIWTFDAKNAIRALELLGKHQGMFTDKNKEQEQTPQEVILSAVIRRELLHLEAERLNNS